ncbi:MAG: FISUMP domain-containing protein [Bacteroidales bacterium]
MRKIFIIVFFLSWIIESNAQFTVSGNVRYFNNTLSYLDSVTVYLRQGTTVIGQVNTNTYGHFIFTNVGNGTYQLTASTHKVWGGCNSSDAVDILKHFVSIQTLTGVKKNAANVDIIPSINTNDAVLVSRRFAMVIDSFPAGDWVFEQKTITIAGASVRQDIKGVCMGDVNGSFSPPSQFVCGQIVTDSRDSQVYPTVLIGEQCWMAKNMNIGEFIYGVGDQTNNYVIEKFCYQNQTSNCSTFGGLYQWGEMMQYDTVSGGQGICPSGFHVPTNVEWDILINGLGGYSVAGNLLRTGGGSGFEALMAGWVIDCQKFRKLGVEAYFWTSNQYYGLYAYSRILNWSNGVIINTYEAKGDGLSVRCIKD